MRVTIAVCLLWALGATASALYLYRDARTWRHEAEGLRTQLSISERSRNVRPAEPPSTPLPAAPQPEARAAQQPAPAEAKEQSNTTPPALSAPLGEARAREIEELVVLDAEEHARLAEELSGVFSADLNSSRVRERIQTALGADKTAAFYAQLSARAAKREQEQIDLEVFRLQRSLSLTPEQAAPVREIVTQAQALMSEVLLSYRRKGEEAALRHESDDRASLRQAYSEMKQIAGEAQTMRADYYRAKLRPLLTEEQYNAFLASEAESTQGLLQ